MNIEFVGYSTNRNIYKFVCPHCNHTVRVAFKPGSTVMWNHGCGSQFIYTQKGLTLTESVVQEVGRA